MICKHCEKEIECTVCATRHERYVEGANLTNKNYTTEKRKLAAKKAWKKRKVSK